MKNQLKQKLEAGQTVFGIFQTTNSLDQAHILSRVGFDCVIIDREHGAMSIDNAGHMVSLYQAGGCETIIREAADTVQLIKQALDSGAGGIMVPMVNSAAQARAVVSLCKYPPLGSRGMGPGRAALYGSGGGDPTYFSTANDETLVIVQIETVEAVEAVEDIVLVPGVDVAFVGPMDLSSSMGLSGQLDHPRVLEACQKVAQACRKHGVAAGVFTGPRLFERYLQWGYTFVMGGLDSALLYQAARGLREQFEHSREKAAK